MDHKILSVLVLFLLSTMFISCEKDADIPLPEDEPKLVVYSYITPTDSVIAVSVASSDPIFDNSNSDTYQPISNASVTIKNSGTSYTLTYNASYSVYTISTTTLPVVPGQLYELEVSAPNFETVTANTIVPNTNNFDLTSTLTHTTAPNAGNNEPKFFEFMLGWKHYDNSNYYRLAHTFYTLDTSTFGSSDTSFQTRHFTYYTSEQAYSGMIADNVKTGSEIYSEPYNYHYGFYHDLIVSTYDYYKFHESLNNYTSGDPFSEPTLVYNNMKNGYGIFAGYLRYRIRTVIQ